LLSINRYTNAVTGSAKDNNNKKYNMINEFQLEALYF